jgi:hypothetical protein
MKKYLLPGIISFIALNTLATFSSALSKLFGFALLLWAGWLLIKIMKEGSAATKSNPLRDRIAGFNYNHFYENSGIGIDSSAKEIHLISKGEYKVYPFEKIRNWETNIVTGGLTRSAPSLTSAMAATADNLRQQRENKANTGLFLQVKDVDHPKWHIEFPVKDIQRQLERWMEILRQEVNEST